MIEIDFLSSGNIHELNLLQEYTNKNNDINSELLKKIHKKYIDIGCSNITTSNYAFTPDECINWKAYTLKSCQILYSLKKDNRFTILGCLPPYYSQKTGFVSKKFADFYTDLIDIMDSYVDKYIIETCYCPLQLFKILNILFEKTKKKILVSINPQGKITKNHIQFLCNMEYSQIDTILINCCDFNEMKAFYNTNFVGVRFWKFSFGFYCNKTNDEIKKEELLDFILNVKDKEILIGGCCGYTKNEMKNLINYLDLL